MSRSLKEAYQKAVITPEYESSDRMEYYYQQRKLKSIRFVLSKILGGRSSLILDVGAGKGIVLDLASTISTRLWVVSLEISKDCCIVLREKGYNPIISDVEHMPIKSEAVDVVLFLDVIEHLYSPDKVLPDIFRILKTDGNCLISTPNKFGIYEYKELVYAGAHLIDIVNTLRGRPRTYFPYHVRLYGLKGLLGILKRYDFHEKCVLTIGSCLPFLGNVEFLAQKVSVDIFRSNVLEKILKVLERRMALFNYLIILLCEKSA
jgi:ubiquinone/menaquinone biosynthesis C-methylase UbiE